MKKSPAFKTVIVLATVVVLALLMVFVWGMTTARQRTAQVMMIGETNVILTSCFGDGSPQFPYYDLPALQITNLPTSGRVGLFLMTNGTPSDAYFNLTAIEVWQDGQWVRRPPLWGGFGWFVRSGQGSVAPVPEPDGDTRWRLQVGVQKQSGGLLGFLNEIAGKRFNTVFYPPELYTIYSVSPLSRDAEQTSQ